MHARRHYPCSWRGHASFLGHFFGGVPSFLDVCQTLQDPITLADTLFVGVCGWLRLRWWQLWGGGGGGSCTRAYRPSRAVSEFFVLELAKGDPTNSQCFLDWQQH